MGDAMTTFARTAARTAVALAALWSTAAVAGPFPFFEPPSVREAPPAVEEPTHTTDLPANLRRQVVAYATSEAPGTIVIDTPHTTSISCSAAARPCATASASAARASP